MSHTIEPKHIAAAIHTAAFGDPRDYLNGVHVEGRVVVSTDGLTLSAYLGPESSEYLPPFTIPLDAAKLIAKIKSSLVFAHALPDGRIDVGGVVFVPVGGKFPDFRRVVGTPTNEPHDMQFNPELLIKFTKIAKVLGVKSSPCLYASNGGARVAIGGAESEFIGVIMPLRYGAKQSLPICGDWLK